jgi:hypothetical protein
MREPQSEAWTCPNGHFGNVMYGDAEDTWGDTECPECGAEPGDKLDPDIVTGDAPGLEDWIGDNAPQCQACEEPAEFIMPADREEGLEKLRWVCPHCTEYLHEDGLAVNVDAYLLRQELAAETAGKQVAA